MFVLFALLYLFVCVLLVLLGGGGEAISTRILYLSAHK